MTDQEIYNILYDTHCIIDHMTKDKVKKILNILGPLQQYFGFKLSGSDKLNFNTKKILTNLMVYGRLTDVFDRNQIKALYRILSEYHIYPTCPLCGEPIIRYSNNKHPDEFSWDHVIPKSLGGENELYNLQPTHKECNNDKGNNLLYHAHYTVEVVVNINFSNNMSKHSRKRKKKKFYRKGYHTQCRCDYCR